jgi:hypothetical protein
MAPGNTYLDDPAVRRKLGAHNNRLIQGSRRWFYGETPDEDQDHWDFNGAVELDLLSKYVQRFAEPDFKDGKVTVADAAVATYGYTDAYLENRIAGHMVAYSAFNKKYSVNGLVFSLGALGTIVRADRSALAKALVERPLTAAEEQLVKSATRHGKRVQRQYKRAVRIDPDGRPELESMLGERESDIGRATQQALASGGE